MPPKPKTPINDVSPILQKFREFLLGRKHTLHVRFPELWASRSPPPPHLPDGFAHKLKGNYYFNRDPRRHVKPPEVILAKGARPKQIEDAIEPSQKITPGKPWKWD